MGEQEGDRDLEFALGRAKSLLIMIGAGSFDIEISRNLVNGHGIDPAAVRDVVRRSSGSPMTPPPGRLSDETVDLVEWSEEAGGVVRTPVWTEAGTSSLQLLITVLPEHYGATPSGRLWSSFVSGVVDEEGRDVLTPTDAPAPASPYPEWTEERDGQAIDDPRIPRSAFTGATYGIKFGQLLDGIRRVYPDALSELDQLNEGQAATVVLDAFFGSFYGDGIDAAYQRLDVDGAPRRLAAAAELVGADAYADVFAQVDQSLPPHVRENATDLRTYLEELETAAWDAGDDDTYLRAYADRIYQLEDSGDVVWHHLAHYVEQHPDQFFTTA